MADFKIDPDYKEVAERIDDLYTKFPDASLRGSWEILTLGDKTFVVYTAKCYRDRDDVVPSIGTAMEEYPGKTPYTKGSEIQNAETSAWGRAIVAAGASRSKKIASADDVRVSQARQEVDAEENKPAPRNITDELTRLMNTLPTDQRGPAKTGFKGRFGLPSKLKVGQVEAATRFVHALMPDLEDSDPAAPAPAPGEGAPEQAAGASDEQTASGSAAVAYGAGAPEGNDGSDSETSGSERGEGERRSEASAPPPPTSVEPPKGSTAQQRQTLGIRFSELEREEIIRPGDKAEIVGILTLQRTTTTTEITFEEAVKMIALAHMLAQGAIKMIDDPRVPGARTLLAERQPGTSFLLTLPGNAEAAGEAVVAQ